MAAVSTAMYRPGGALDPSCYATQRIYDTTDATKHKKWSSRLKLSSSGSTKGSDKLSESPYIYGTISAPGGSALSKSMKYAETWLYGTVRTQNPSLRPSLLTPYPEVPGPVLISTPQKPTPHNYAVILCSCPEYLNGTKKSSSTKVSICKKCKGSRLPLTITESPRLLLGGTVRGPHINREPGILRAGTVKVHNSKSRPSILKSHNDSADPYDLMRRTRLAPPHEARIGSQFSTSRTRAKSISPCRVRTRRVSPPSDNGRKNRSKSVSRVNDVWVDDNSNDGNGQKRSILQCDINPYELVKHNNDYPKSLVEIEFDDDYGDIFNEGDVTTDRKHNNKLNELYGNYKAISGQRIKITDELNSCSVDLVTDYNNDDLKNQDIKTHELSPSLSLPNIKNEKKKPPITSKYSNKKNVSHNTSSRPKQKTFSPKRPPRRMRNAKTDDDSESDNQRPPEKVSSRRQPNDTTKNCRHKNQNTDTIKSILKKPRTYDTNEFTLKEPSKHQSVQEKRANTSQFYLPNPTNQKNYISSHNTILHRKRVQFLVENDETKVIYTAEFDLSENTVRGIPGDIGTEIEEVVAKGDVVSQSLFKTNEENIANYLPKDNGVYEDIANIDQDKNVQPPEPEVAKPNSITTEKSMTPKVPVLRRSESERLPSPVNISPPKFLDTMALRPKTKHGQIHKSRVFLSPFNDINVIEKQKTDQLAKVGARLRENYLVNDNKPLLCDMQYNKISTESGNLSDSSDITQEILNSLRKDIIISPEPPPRLKSRDKVIKFKKNNYVKTRFVRMNSASSTSDEWSDNNDYEKKTILRVKQFDTESEDSNISYDTVTPNSNTENESRRTSIQISGDDCYSTANVSDDTPIYLSSVVVNDNGGGSTCDTYQSSAMVTITVSTPQKENQKSKSQIYIASGELSNSKEMENVNDNIFKEMSREDELELGLILNNPVEAVRRNLIPHVCGKKDEDSDNTKDKETTENKFTIVQNDKRTEDGNDTPSQNGFVEKLLDDPVFGHLAEGLDSDLVKKLIENSLIKLQETKVQKLFLERKDETTIETLIATSLNNIKNQNGIKIDTDNNSCNGASSKCSSSVDGNIITINNGNCANLIGNVSDASVCLQNEDISCSAPYGSMEYESGAIGMFSDLSDCYIASASELSTEDDTNSTRSKFYQMLVDESQCEIELSSNADEDHHYETIRINNDPIYEEIGDMPPPLPLNPPPQSLSLLDDDKRNGSRSIFEGASKYDILSYLVDAKERGIDDEETYVTNYDNENDRNDKIINNKMLESRLCSNTSQISNASDSSEDNSLVLNSDSNDKSSACKKSSAEIERNDSGVGSETSKSSRSRLQGKISPNNTLIEKDSPIHLCEDCDSAVETQLTEKGASYAPLVCRKCAKKRAERKEIITEIVETEEKYGRDLLIILEEFNKPMLVAGLLTQEQLSAIFLNVEELIENNQVLSEKLRDALEIALEQGDEDLLTVNVGKILLECSGMLTAFQTYCVRQAGAALLLAGLEKDKELLRIFLRVSQMENTVLRRMNLNSFLMVPVQRVTKYPLLLSRLYRATPTCAAEREDVRAAQRCVESRLEEMNAAAAAAAAAARDVPLWRRLALARRTAHDLHVADIRLRKMAVDVLDWNHEDARFAMEGKLLFTQPNDNNWRKGRTIKLTPINALLVTNGKPTSSHKAIEAREASEALFARSGVREAALLLVREKAGRYTLQRDPLFLDRCVVAADHEPEHFFEVHEITTKDSYIFKAEESTRTRSWYKQLQFHAQGSGAWRKRRNALANIMINPMLTRN